MKLMFFLIYYVGCPLTSSRENVQTYLDTKIRTEAAYRGRISAGSN